MNAFFVISTVTNTKGLSGLSRLVIFKKGMTLYQKQSSIRCFSTLLKIHCKRHELELLFHKGTVLQSFRKFGWVCKVFRKSSFAGHLEVIASAISNKNFLPTLCHKNRTNLTKKHNWHLYRDPRTRSGILTKAQFLIGSGEAI